MRIISRSLATSLLLLTAFFANSPFTFAESIHAKEILNCAKYTQARQYLPAADCYEKLAKKIPHTAEISEADRTQKGYLYSEASKNFAFEAMREEKPAVAAYLRERALQGLEEIIKHQWLPKIRGKRRTRAYTDRIVALRKEIRYTPLAISTSASDAQILISGYQYQAQAKQQFNQELRPGRYKIVVSFVGEATPRVREVTLQPQISLVLSFLQKPPLPNLLIAGYIVGGIALVGGGILLGFGIHRIQEGNSCFNNPECAFYQGTILNRQDLPKNQGNIDNNSEFQAYNNISLGLSIGGGVLTAIGIGAIIAAGIAHANLTKEDFQKKEQLLPTSPSKTTTSLSRTESITLHHLE
jgi:hypothetical protein